MTGIRLDFDSSDVQAATKRTLAALADPQPMFRDMGEYLLLAHRRRFSEQRAPDGTPWAALTPRYLKRKKKNKDKILFLDGYLAITQRYQVSPTEMQYGSDRPYAALMHFGGDVRRAARQQDVFFKMDSDGNVGNRFVKKKKSNFAQTVSVAEHIARYPARPWLGISEQDRQPLIDIAVLHFNRAGK